MTKPHRYTLREWMAEQGDKAPTQRALAIKLGVTPGRITQLLDSQDWPPELALIAETATHGAMNASALSPIVAWARRPQAYLDHIASVTLEDPR